MNMDRMNKSMIRLALPPLDTKGFLQCIKELLKIERNWIPDKDGKIK